MRRVGIRKRAHVYVYLAAGTLNPLSPSVIRPLAIATLKKAPNPALLPSPPF